MRAPTNWGGTVASATVTVPAGTKVLVTTLNPEFVSGETIRRMRGTVSVGGLTAGLFAGAIGAYVASDRSITAGVASLMDPVSDVQEDAWMWYQSVSGNSAGDGDAGAFGTHMYEIDNKAMRRIETGYSLAFVAANGFAVGITLVFLLSLWVLGSEAS